MPYDEILTARIRGCQGPLPDLTGKKMFCEVGFMLNGNMT